ncbi:hypothetical protein NUW54_g9752 [Trametes sanguinea]|uniref:Uncharacterized protein n=1 Tax=Trametes sanguinea TaxID=158606 RepID=A0ACC1P510_9APHY|nr:hypothetical protein NUW54_g9752 [Trametes sanguinea]
MILLDGLDKHDNSDPQSSTKLVAQSSVPVTRVHTPTPSLPDYEASQAQLKPTPLSYPELQKKRSRKRRWRKCALYSLLVYFFLTIAIGVPLIVVKLRRKAYTKANPYNSWSAGNPLPPKTINLGDAPLRLSSAKSCNTWSTADTPDGPLLRSELEYYVPVNGSLFLNTNITYSGNGTYLSHFSGQLLVGVNDDPSASDAAVHVTMHHTTPELRNATNVCLMQTGQGGGLYLFTPFNLTRTDTLSFNITLLLPQPHNKSSPRQIPQLLCHLPNFKQTYQQLDPYVTFGNVVLGGAMSEVSIQSIQASQAVVKASLAEINGKFTVDSSLSLETVSAPINADIHLYNNDPSGPPTFMHLTTGNSALNANVTMYVPSDSDSDDKSYGPHFLAHAETFNAPLTLALMHDAESVPANVASAHIARSMSRPRELHASSALSPLDRTRRYSRSLSSWPSHRPVVPRILACSSRPSSTDQACLLEMNGMKDSAGNATIGEAPRLGPGGRCSEKKPDSALSHEPLAPSSPSWSLTRVPICHRTTPGTRFSLQLLAEATSTLVSRGPTLVERDILFLRTTITALNGLEGTAHAGFSEVKALQEEVSGCLSRLRFSSCEEALPTR